MQTYKSISIGLIAAVAFAFAFTTGIAQAETTKIGDSPALTGDVTVQKNGETIAQINNVMLDGENIIRQQVTGENTGDTTSSGFNTIALGDGTDTDAFNSEDTDLTDDGVRYGLEGQEDEEGIEFVAGLEPIEAGTSYEEGQDPGQWTIEATFTAQETADVAQTAIEIDGQTGSSADGPFFDNLDSNTFAATGLERTIPLEDGDELTITWEVTPQNQ